VQGEDLAKRPAESGQQSRHLTTRGDFPHHEVNGDKVMVAACDVRAKAMLQQRLESLRSNSILSVAQSIDLCQFLSKQHPSTMSTMKDAELERVAKAWVEMFVRGNNEPLTTWMCENVGLADEEKAF
jgi:hypothetical protein